MVNSAQDIRDTVSGSGDPLTSLPTGSSTTVTSPGTVTTPTEDPNRRIERVPDSRSGLVQEFEVIATLDSFGRVAGEQVNFLRWLVPDAGSPDGFRQATQAEIQRFVQGVDPESGGGGAGGFSVSELGPVAADLRRQELGESRRSALAGESVERARLEQEVLQFNATQSAELEGMRIRTEQFNANHELNIRQLTEDMRQADNQFRLESANLGILQTKLRVETEQGNRRIALQTEQLLEQTRARVESQRIERDRLDNEINLANARFRMDAAALNASNDLRRQELGEERRQFNISAKQSLAETIGRLQSRPGDLGELAGFLTSLEATLPGSIRDDTNFITERSLAPLEIAHAAAASIDQFDPFTAQTIDAEQAANAGEGKTVAPVDEGAITDAVGDAVTPGQVAIPTAQPGQALDPTSGQVAGPDPEAFAPIQAVAPQAPAAPATAPNVAVEPDGTRIDGNGDGSPDVLIPAAPSAADPAPDPAFFPGNEELFDPGVRLIGSGGGPVGTSGGAPPTEAEFPTQLLNDAIAAVGAPLPGNEELFDSGVQLIGSGGTSGGAPPTEEEFPTRLFNEQIAEAMQEPVLRFPGLVRPIPTQAEIDESIFGFADGGVGFFNTPTTIRVGEGGPEMVAAQPVGTPNQTQASGSSPSARPEFFKRAADLALELSGLGRDFNPLDVAGPGTDPILIERAAALASARRGIDPEFFKRRVQLLKPQGVREAAVGRTR